MPRFQYLKNVVTLDYDERKCIGCGMCLEVCPHGVFRLEGKRAEVLDRDDCMECGACSRNCPSGAISVQAGVGCAAAVINGMIGRSGECSCSVKSGENAGSCCSESSSKVKSTCG